MLSLCPKTCPANQEQVSAVHLNVPAPLCSRIRKLMQPPVMTETICPKHLFELSFKLVCPPANMEWAGLMNYTSAI